MEHSMDGLKKLSEELQRRFYAMGLDKKGVLKKDSLPAYQWRGIFGLSDDRQPMIDEIANDSGADIEEVTEFVNLLYEYGREWNSVNNQIDSLWRNNS